MLGSLKILTKTFFAFLIHFCFLFLQFLTNKYFLSKFYFHSSFCQVISSSFMPISFEKKVAPLESQCCFVSFTPNPELNQHSSPRIFRNTHHPSNNFLIESEDQIKEKKEGIQSMKKSISSINLKRKFSDGYPTNRVSINQSQFIPRHQKRFITHSMDTEVLQEYLPHYQSTGSLDSGAIINSKNQERRVQYFMNGSQTLDSLAEKFKKSRDIQIQNFVNQTKKNAQFQHPIKTLIQTKNLQNKSARQGQKVTNFRHYEHKIPQTITSYNRLGFRSPQKQTHTYKTFQNTASTRLVHQGQNTENQTHQKQNYHLNIQMSQVDSMIIEINAPKNPQKIDQKNFFKKIKPSIGSNMQITESKHLQGSKIDKTKKRSINAERQLANYETMTVKSDYQEEEYERVQKIEESAIMMNFFNPPSFIREKLALSGARNS